MERLTVLVSQMTTEQQLALGGVISLTYVTLETRGPEAAKTLVENAPVPSELQTLKGAILAEFSAGI